MEDGSARVVQQMREDGLLPDEAPRPIQPLYSQARRSYQQAAVARSPVGVSRGSAPS